MMNKLIDMTYDAAAYEFIKELDLCDSIGEILVDYHHDIADVAIQLHEFNNYWRDCDQWADVPPHQPVSPLIEKDAARVFIDINMHLPNFILLNSELDWNTFISAYFTFVQESIRIEVVILQKYQNPDNEKETAAQMNLLRQLQDTFEGVLKLIEIGASYQNLIDVAGYLVKELKQWSQSKPAAVRLSDAYLKAIGFDIEE